MRTLSLPGIFKIGYLEAEKLSPQLMLKSQAGIPIAVLTDIVDVAFIGKPTCSAVSEDDNNGRSEKTTLVFSTLQDIPTDRALAWVVQCVNGKNYLIGTKERPSPIMKISEDLGAPSGNVSAIEIEITHIALKSLLPVAV